MRPGMGAATWVEADAELTFDACLKAALHITVRCTWMRCVVHVVSASAVIE
jgi:hypothetical protein